MATEDQIKVVIKSDGNTSEMQFPKEPKWEKCLENILLMTRQDHERNIKNAKLKRLPEPNLSIVITHV